MADKHYIVRHAETLEVVDRNCHDETEFEDIRRAWGARYEILEVPADFDAKKHHVNVFGDVTARTPIAPKLSKASARKDDKITISGLPPQCTLKINGRMATADDAGKMEFTSRDGDDFIEGVGNACGAVVLPDRDRVARKKTTNSKYLEKHEHAQAFLASRA